MKLLFDENLSFRLVGLLADAYPESMHVAAVGLDRADDADIWRYAAAHDFVVVSKDDDFRQRALAVGAPPKVVWLRVGNCPTDRCVMVLMEATERIESFVADADAAVLVLGHATA